ncbi:MAG TPA: alanine racemase [Dissulfurispiraceae bacterium]|nr:alanine racemase [Dissulfurispiraceae bacterium]
MHRGILAEINLAAAADNLQAVKKLSGKSSIIAVVKADAYGHGAIELSKVLSAKGANYLAVAFTDEAKILRDADISSKIMVLFDSDPEDVIKYNLIPVIAEIHKAEALAVEAEKHGVQIPVHIKIDTGMGRLGLTDNVIQKILAIADMRGLFVEGIMSHLSVADMPDSAYTKKQLSVFNALRTELTHSRLHIKMFHIANSAAIMGLPEATLDAVRPGLMLYGYSSAVGCESCTDLQPVMTAKTRLLAVRKLKSGTPVSYAGTFITKRESLIGVIAAGYADGFCSKLSNNAEVLIRGRRVPVVGRVCMDLTMIDVTGIEDVSENDEVVIIGRQGSEFIGADEIAKRIETIPYEVLTSIGSRARRTYSQ